MKKIHHLAVISTVTASLFLSACTKSETNGADSTAAAAIKARQYAMQDWRGANESMKAMIERPDSFDVATFKERADFLISSAADVWKNFEGEATKGGESSQEIWANPEAFKAQAQAFDAAVAELAAAAANAKNSGDVEAAFAKVAENCGACHKQFKEK